MIRDARGYELKIGDDVAFNHPCGYRQREMFIGTIVAFGKYISIELHDYRHTIVDKYSSSLFKLYKEEK
jgi:hypothetical protein